MNWLWAKWLCWWRGHLWHYGNPTRICERCGADIDYGMGLEMEAYPEAEE